MKYLIGEKEYDLETINRAIRGAAAAPPSEEQACERRATVWDLDSMEDSECSPANWLSCEQDGLPKLGVYVLGRHGRGTWSDPSDPEGVNYVWVKRVLNHPRGVRGNNTKHYIWDQFGPGKFDGPDITHWCYVSRLG